MREHGYRNTRTPFLVGRFQASPDKEEGMVSRPGNLIVSPPRSQRLLHPVLYNQISRYLGFFRAT
jgi:hypothetical protein